MGLFKSTRLAWSIAIASLALWAASAPLSSGQTLPIAAALLQQQSTGQSDDAVVAQDTPCPPPSEAMTQSPDPEPAASVSGATSGATEGTFQLCGPDEQAARAIETLIAGRSFSASLTSTGSGCASLTIRTTSAAMASGRSSSTMNVSLGSGQRLSIQIVSEGGLTHVSIGQAA
jgi:hypothetical protein